uniref:WASH-7_C domain-containing protein n=1 Tax=Macrostomum lignano TaxID=282301 RepID=A0A1I8FID4_9PLAT
STVCCPASYRWVRQTAVSQFTTSTCFIVTHQAFELWFKQVIFEIDSVRQLFQRESLRRRQNAAGDQRLNRVVVIMKLLTEQIMILETMTPLDFMDFRRASGTGLWFFKVSNSAYSRINSAFARTCALSTTSSTTGGSSPMTTACGPWRRAVLSRLCWTWWQRWLERTPGLNRTEDCDFQFWEEYKMGSGENAARGRETDPSLKQLKMADYKKQLDAFHSIDNLEAKEISVTKSFQGALMIALYRDEPRFSQPFHLLTLLMDTDALLTKW